MFAVPMHDSIIGKAIEKHIIDLDVTNFREFTRPPSCWRLSVWRWAGMLLRAQPICATTIPTSSWINGYPPEKYFDGSAEAVQSARCWNVNDEHLLLSVVLWNLMSEPIDCMMILCWDFILTGRITSINWCDYPPIQGLGNNQSSGGIILDRLLEEPQYTWPAEFLYEKRKYWWMVIAKRLPFGIKEAYAGLISVVRFDWSPEFDQHAKKLFADVGVRKKNKLNVTLTRKLLYRQVRL